MHDPVIVMGMMRSGTTLLAEMLHKGGTPMLNAVEEADPSYDHGLKYERRLTLDLNLAILGLDENQEAVTILDLPLGSLPEDAVARLSEEVKDQPWGFKNPRTTMTYPVWCRTFPHGPRLYVYRSHEEVARRYFGTRRNLLRQCQRGRLGIHAWVRFNEQVLRNLAADRLAGRPAVLIRYEELMQDCGMIARIEDALGVCLEDARCPQMRRNQVRGSGEKRLYRLLARPYERQIAHLYHDLGEARLPLRAGNVSFF